MRQGAGLIQNLLISLLLLVVVVSSRAQPGALDPDFYRYSVFDGVVYSLTVQPNGNVLVGGAFSNITGISRNGIARVHSNGSVDATFNPGIGVEGNNASVYTMVYYKSGTNLDKVIIAGSFTQFNRVARASIARLNSDGTLDTAFNPGSGVQDGEVFSSALQLDGKIVLGGSFHSVQGVLRNGIARLNDDGSLDTTFDPGTGADGGVFGVAVQPDGKIVLAGAFSKIGETDCHGIARLTSTGQLDALTSFNPGTGIQGGKVNVLALQADGSILIAGDFTSVQGAARDGVARLNSDGSLDLQFAPDSGGTNSITIWAMASQLDGKVLVGGEFTVMGGGECDGIARLDSKGKLDPSFTNSVPDVTRFDVGNGEYLETMAVQTDGSVVVGGTFEVVNNFYRAALARLGPDGSVDPIFNQESGTTFIVESTAVQPDGKLLLGGQFGYVNGAPHTGLGRLTADGQVDDSFKADLDYFSKVKVIVPYPLSTNPSLAKILVGGTFSKVNGFSFNGLARINMTGEVETNFTPVLDTNDVDALVIQPDGKILIGGSFTNVNHTSRNGIARLNADGSLDADFDPGRGISGNGVYSIALQTNDQILIGGAFTNFNGVPRNSLARLATNGALDLDFNPSVSNGAVRAVLVQSDGKILIGGGFTTVAGEARNGIARLNSDGTLDSNFNPGAGIGDGDEASYEAWERATQGYGGLRTCRSA